jgi:hypothetical protein
MRRGPIRKWQPKAAFQPEAMRPPVLSGISPGFPELSRSYGQVTHVLLTRPPLGSRRASPPQAPLDLHVLGTPPAFVLSQDQTLHQNIYAHPKLKGALSCSVFKVQSKRDFFNITPGIFFVNTKIYISFSPEIKGIEPEKSLQVFQKFRLCHSSPAPIASVRFPFSMRKRKCR